MSILEMPLREISFGGGDFRVPNYDIAGSDGSHQTDFAMILTEFIRAA